MHIPIVYQDEHIVVVCKPSGLLVHRSLIDKHETQFLMQLVRNQINQHVYTVHRLDKPTSGLLVMALNSDIAKALSEQFSQHRVRKHYTALLRGYVDESVTIDYPLVEQLDKMTDKLNKENPPQQAITHLEPLARFELPFAVGRYQTGRYSLVKLTPETGRKHQLRRHMKHIFHPIVGDTTHGDGKQNAYAQQYFSLHRLALCANQLHFEHPISRQNLSFTTPFDETLSGIQRLFDKYTVWRSAKCSGEVISFLNK
ncbi:tRNA pseudouridine(65) synthase TruC [Glaciecola siphonariae]|uniref:tRNA pseudouridine synthase C n=1 Tax=Glaciecola siphonariae TaxID=521012 RepID=A0ABV9LUS4_9ALTE